VGIAHFPDDAQTADELLRKADSALYRAKQGGRGLVHRYDAQRDELMAERHRLEQEIKEGIATGQFVPFYHPIVGLERRNERLRAALKAAQADHDFVLIDCPPSLSLLTLNGLCSAHGVVVPMQCEYFALEGLSDLVNTIKQVHANLNRELEIIGLLRVMFDPRITLQQQVSDQLKAHFGDKVFRTVIPRNIRLAEAPSYGQPGVVFDPASKGAKAYIDFGAEMIERVRAL
jgi:cellulose biosynthesis protein BcsQ